MTADTTKAREGIINLENVQSAPKSGLGRCPYCHEGIDPQEVGLWSCTGCGAYHHLECLEDFGHCAVYGCEAAGPYACALSPSDYEQLKARRRARMFAARHMRHPSGRTTQLPTPEETLADALFKIVVALGVFLTILMVVVLYLLT